MNNRNKIKEIIDDLTNSSNKEIQDVLEFLNEDFEQTKNTIIKLTNHLDNTENLYNKVLKEYQKRTKLIN